MQRHMGVSKDWILGAVIFRAALAILGSFVMVLLCGGRVIRWLMTKKMGDNPEFYVAKLNDLTKDKKNTPTMGGILIIGTILVNCLIFADMQNFYVRMALFCMVY